ncbi:aminotransferase class III-fold pyridoxal phosphate-dependent enzyme, partial [Anaerostipes hadrus]|uniref:aminotransferase class III-fold pyridoxal phosphate-dependent enzyme n=1 Tax=Anaerostipes hadrus TaxID=649756 RepID=UPI002ED2CDDD
MEGVEGGGGAGGGEGMMEVARGEGRGEYGPKRDRMVRAEGGVHGRTVGAMSATGQRGNGCQGGFGPMTDGFSYAPYNNLQAFKDACTENT